MTLAAYPLVPRDEVGFRIQVTAANTHDEIDQLIAVLGELADSVPPSNQGATGSMTRPQLRPGRNSAWAYYLAAMAVLIGAYPSCRRSRATP